MRLLEKPKSAAGSGGPIDNMLSWHHSGFHVYLSWPDDLPDDEKGLENLARYIIRACFSQQRMDYIPAPDALGRYRQGRLHIQRRQEPQIFDAVDLDSPARCAYPWQIRTYGALLWLLFQQFSGVAEKGAGR